ncbi:MAG TPA: nitrous oxide reductase accessory protein NosL [Rhodothermales bacterium]
MRWPGRTLVLVGLCAIALAGCRPSPRPVVEGRDACAHCKMKVTDARFAAELITRKGKVHVFDSIECLAVHVADAVVPLEDVHSAWVTDFADAENFLRAAEAQYVRAESVRSPMGMNLAAFGTSVTPASMAESFGGEVLNWDDVIHLVADHP